MKKISRFKNRGYVRPTALILAGGWIVLSLFMVICWNSFLSSTSLQHDISVFSASGVQQSSIPSNNELDCHVESNPQIPLNQSVYPLQKVELFTRQHYLHRPQIVISRRLNACLSSNSIFPVLSLFQQKTLLVI